MSEIHDRLREQLPPGSTVWTILRHVSRSGMSRSIEVRTIRDDYPYNLTRDTAAVLGERVDRDNGGVKVDGCGMDMGFHLVYSLSRELYLDGFECIGEGCPSSDHSNGDRDYTPHHHSDGGYALKHRWM